MKPYSQFKIPKTRYEFFKLIRKADNKQMNLKELCTKEEYNYLVRKSKKYYCHSHGHWLESYNIDQVENKYYAPFFKMLLCFKLKFGNDYNIILKKDRDEENGEFWFPQTPLTLGYFDDRNLLINSSSVYNLYDVQHLFPQFIKKPVQEWIGLGEFKYELSGLDKKPTAEQKKQLDAPNFVANYNAEGLRLAKAIKEYFWNKIEVNYAPVSEYWFSKKDEVIAIT